MATTRTPGITVLAPATRRRKLPLDLTRGHISTRGITELYSANTAKALQKSDGPSFRPPRYRSPRAVDQKPLSKTVIAPPAELALGCDT